MTENTNTLWSKIWKYFLSGILIASPISLTAYMVWLFITTIDDKFKTVLPIGTYLPFELPGIGMIIAFTAFTTIGALATGFLGRFLVRSGEKIVNSMPIVRSMYATLKQIFEAILQRDKNSFKEVVLVQYPRKGIWSLGFVTGITKGEVQQDTNDEVLNVFIPTTPNPTSGYLLFVPRTEVKTLSMTVEQGIKMVISAGIITPDHSAVVKQKKLTKK